MARKKTTPAPEDAKAPEETTPQQDPPPAPEKFTPYEATVAIPLVATVSAPDSPQEAGTDPVV